MWATMIVSEQEHPFRPPIAALRPVLVSEPSSRIFSALVYCGGRWCVSILATCVIPESLIRTASYTPTVTTTRMPARATEIQARILARRDRKRFMGSSGASGVDIPSSAQRQASRRRPQPIDRLQGHDFPASAEKKPDAGNPPLVNLVNGLAPRQVPARNGN